MGIYVTGSLLPYELTQQQWEQAYEESLQLVDAYDFLDIIHNKEKYANYGLDWVYVEKSKERNFDGQLGVNIFGAYAGCISTEGQDLHRDLSRYYPREMYSHDIILPEPGALCCHDALIGRLYNIVGFEKYQDSQWIVFGNKTQGYPHHVPLLAIGLLLEDRLGKAFTIYGNITCGQIKAAIEWANAILENPISWPCTLDNAKLLERIQAFVPREKQLASFFDLTYCAADEDMYQILRRHFSEAEFADHWKEDVLHHKPGTIGSSNFFESYFRMTDDLQMLTKVCSTKYTMEEFAKELASSMVFERDKTTDNPIATLSADSDKETPETIETTMGKMFALLGGGFPYNRAVERYIPLQQGIQDIVAAYRDIGETATGFEELLNNAIGEATPKGKLVSERIEIIDEFSNIIQKQAEEIDIFEPEDLVFFELGDTINPGIKTNLNGIRNFVDTHKEETAQYYMKAYADEEATDKVLARMSIIVKQCRKMLLPKTVWDLFEQRIEEDVFFNALLGLLRIESGTLPIWHYVKGLLYNPILFEQVLLSDDVGWLDSVSS